MIKYGRSIRWYNDYVDEVNFSIKQGIDFMQIWYMKGEILLDKIAEPKLEEIKRINFPVMIHAVLDINEFDEHIPKLIEILSYLDHKELIVHPICESEEITEATIHKLSKKVSKANELLGLEGIKLLIENNSRLDPINYTTKELNILFSKNEDVELLLDIAHIDNYEHLKEIINIKKPTVLHIADKRFDQIHEHLPIGQGELEFHYIFKEVLSDFKGKVILEVVDHDQNIIESLKIIKDILE